MNMKDIYVISEQTSAPVAEGYVLYKRRWFLLTSLSILNLSNAILWLSFAPVAYITAEFYSTTIAIVNLLSVVFMITGIPCGIVATWLLDTFGLRWSLVMSSWLNFVGSLIRVVSALDGIDENARLPLVFLGQVLAALAQPFVLFAPTKLASQWFPDNQRAIANMVSTMCNPLGIMLAAILSPILASEAGKIPFMLAIESIPAILAVVMISLGVCSNDPPSPPSASADAPFEPFLIGVKALFKNKMYWLLAWAVGGGIGLFSVLTTLLSQILCPWGYDDNFAGAVCTSAMIGAGLVGGLIAGIYVDRSKKYTEVVKVCYVIAVLALIAFAVLQNHAGLWVPIAFTCGLFGIVGLPVYPIGNELSVETTYPVGVTVSSGVVFMIGQLQGIILVAVLSVIGREMSEDELTDSVCRTSEDSDTKVMDMSVPTYVMTGYAALVCAMFVFFFKTPYRRLIAENLNEKSSNEHNNQSAAQTPAPVSYSAGRYTEF